jgi:chromosomal replication initiation ATPase DnaA
MTPRERTLADIGLIALRHGLTRHDVLGRAQTYKIYAARRECYRMLRDRGMHLERIGEIFGRHHTTILAGLKLS